MLGEGYDPQRYMVPTTSNGSRTVTLEVQRLVVVRLAYGLRLAEVLLRGSAVLTLFMAAIAGITSEAASALPDLPLEKNPEKSQRYGAIGYPSSTRQ